MKSKRIITRSILSDLIDGGLSNRSREIRTTSEYKSSNDVPAVYRKKSPIISFTGSFVNSAQKELRHAHLDIQYDVNAKFKGMDIFKAIGDSGTFQTVATISMSGNENGKINYKDFEVEKFIPYYYYAVCFDGKLRFSERTKAVLIRGNNDVFIKPPINRYKDIADHRKGEVSVAVAPSYIHGTGIEPKKIVLVDMSTEKDLGASEDPNGSIRIPYTYAVQRRTMGIKLYDVNDNLIKINGSEIASTIESNVESNEYVQQEMQGVSIIANLNESGIIISFDLEQVNKDMLYARILRRNLTINEKSYSGPDPLWLNNTVMFSHAKEDIVMYDRNVLIDDVYEYKIIGYDDNDNVVASKLHKVLYGAPRKQQEESEKNLEKTIESSETPSVQIKPETIVGLKPNIPTLKV